MTVNSEDRQLYILLVYLAALILLMIAVGWKTDKLPDVLGVLNSIVSGLFGAALAILRQRTTPPAPPAQ